MSLTSPLMVRLDNDSKSFIAEAAKLRKISISDYVRTVTVSQAQREVQGAQQNMIALTPEEQLAFWNALDTPPTLTDAQRQLGRVMRGEK